MTNTTELPERMTPYALALFAGIKPQHAYNLVRQGLIKVTKETCDSCGHTATWVSREEAERYLTARQERIAKQAAAAGVEVAVDSSPEASEFETNEPAA